MGHHDRIVGGSVLTGVGVANGVVRTCDVIKIVVEDREAAGNVDRSTGVAIKVGGKCVVTGTWVLLTVVARNEGSTTAAVKAAQNMCWSALITTPLRLQLGWLAIPVWTRHVHSTWMSSAVSVSSEWKAPMSTP